MGNYWNTIKSYVDTVAGKHLSRFRQKQYQTIDSHPKRSFTITAFHVKHILEVFHFYIFTVLERTQLAPIDSSRCAQQPGLGWDKGGSPWGWSKPTQGTIPTASQSLQGQGALLWAEFRIHTWKLLGHSCLNCQTIRPQLS